MTEFVVELYVSRDSAGAIEEGAERLRGAAQEMRDAGIHVVYLRRIFVPEDETCLLLFEADSVDTVREAARRAGVAFERVTEAVEGPNAEETRP
ncbi:MAG: hypothetical protein ACRDNE_09330 [Gaiellaceae bacterium]